MTSTFDLLADLPLDVERVELQALDLQVSPYWTRKSTLVRLGSDGEWGIGEDVTYEAEDQDRFRTETARFAAGGEADLTGRYDLRSFSARLEQVELFTAEPQGQASRDYRRWAFESAALDLALRQAETSLAQRLDKTLQPVRFVLSMGLGSPPSPRPIEAWLAAIPSLRFKLDVGNNWTEELVRELGALNVVDVVDYKGFYRGTPVDTLADADLYAMVAEHLPRAWLEDPWLDAATTAALEPHRDRITWDAPFHAWSDLEGLGLIPKTVNIKPSRFGTLAELFAVYDKCSEHGIGMYGGGQFELGVGRGQIQLLVSLFHAEAANDVAPSVFHDADPGSELPISPLALQPESIGFRCHTP